MKPISRFSFDGLCERRPFFSGHRDTTFILLNTRGAPDFLGAYHGLFLSLSL